jgi:CelD/BcsL family acetyltransferase involved in cellulose biosynthesis
VRVALVRPDELGPAEVEAWQSMQRLSPALANPFLSPEFTRVVGRFRPAARVAILSEGQSVVGFFPFEKRRLGASVPICGWPGTPAQGLVHTPGLDWDPRELLRKCRLSAWQFDHLIPGQKPFARYQAVLEPTAEMDLSGGFAAYHEALRAKSSRFCTSVARQGRNLAREVGELRFVPVSHQTSDMRTFMAWKSEQYRRIGAVDQFAWPWFVDLLDALQGMRDGHVTGLLSALYAGDKPVAAQFALRREDLVVGWFTAYDLQFKKYSPGLVQFIRLAEVLAADGVSTLDMGKGGDTFKERLKSRDTFVAEGIVTTRSVLGPAHRARSASTRWALRAGEQHPRLFRATRGVRSALRLAG